MFSIILNIGRSDLRMFAWNVIKTCLGAPSVASFRKKRKPRYVPPEPTDHFLLFRWPLVGGDTFSALAPILGPEKKVVMSSSSTVHGGQYENKYLVCTRNSRIDGANGIGGGGNLRRSAGTSSTLRDRNTTKRTSIFQSVSKSFQGEFCPNCILVWRRYYNMFEDWIRSSSIVPTFALGLKKQLESRLHSKHVKSVHAMNLKKKLLQLSSRTRVRPHMGVGDC